MKTIGFIKGEHLQAMREAIEHPGTLYAVAMDRQALWDPATIEKVLQSFPKELVDESDLFLILAECMANAVLHGQAEALGFYARERNGLLLLSFYQIPRMLNRVSLVLSMARKGNIKDFSRDLPGGLGFPILLKLVRQITISTDHSRLQLWLKASKKA